MILKIESTKEHKLRQKQTQHHSSSAIFYAVHNLATGICTHISMINHFLIKRNIPSVDCRIRFFDIAGKLLKECHEIIDEPRVYVFSTKDYLEEDFEGTIALNFEADDNLAVPFCAVFSLIEAANSTCGVHTYGRILEHVEYDGALDIEETYEAGWTLRDNANAWSFAVLHNGEFDTCFTVEVEVTNAASERVSFSFEEAVQAYGQLRIVPGKYIENLPAFLDGDIGHAAVHVKGLKKVFPRMLVGNIESVTPFDTKEIRQFQFTHSNFNFSKAVQPNSQYTEAIFNQPCVPVAAHAIFYPCNLENEVYFEDKKISPNEISKYDVQPTSQISVTSNANLPSRLVGATVANWPPEEALPSECSTGIFIKEYREVPGAWHWGCLCFGNGHKAEITILPNFIDDESEYKKLTLNVYNQSGLVLSQVFDYPKVAKVFSAASLLSEVGPSDEDQFYWYTVTGQQVNQLNIYTTLYRADLSSGFIEHAF